MQAYIPAGYQKDEIEEPKSLVHLNCPKVLACYPWRNFNPFKSMQTTITAMDGHLITDRISFQARIIEQNHTKHLYCIKPLPNCEW